MAGEGYYNRHSPQQAEIATMSQDALRRAVESLPRAITASIVADYGSSQGRNSMGPVRVMLAGLRDRHPVPAPLTVAHVDLPDNDWPTLFETVAGPDSYLVGQHAVYPVAIGRSFYEQVLADSSVAIGWSGTSVQWLSARPDLGPDNMFSDLADPGDHRTWALAAAADWRTFLGHRAKELAPGGRLVISALASSAAYVPFLSRIRDGVHGAVTHGWITQDEARAMTVPTYLRTQAEIESPFEDQGLDLVIQDHTSFVAPDPAFAAFGSHGDLQRFADDEVGQIRGWSEPSLAAALAPARSAADADAAVDGLYSCIRSAVAADPDTGHCDWTMSLLTVARPS
jgi:hypothetical protein